MFNSIIDFGSSFLHSAKNEPAQQQPLPAPEENAVEEAALLRLPAPEEPKRDLSTSVINILSAPLSLLSSSFFQEKVVGGIPNSAIVDEDKEVEHFTVDELETEMESFIEVTAENFLELLDSAIRTNNYPRLKNCFSVWIRKEYDDQYLNLMRANLEPGSDSEKLFSLLLQTKNLLIAFCPCLSPNKEVGLWVGIPWGCHVAMFKTIEDLNTLIPILELKFAYSPPQDSLLNFLKLNPSLLSLKIVDANINLNLPLTEVEQQDRLAALTPMRIAFLKNKYPAISVANREIRKDTHLTAAVLFSGANPREALQIGEEIKEMIKLMPESMHHHEELIDNGLWDIGNCSPLGTACFTANVPIEIIKILVDKGAALSEVERHGEIMALVEALDDEIKCLQERAALCKDVARDFNLCQSRIVRYEEIKSILNQKQTKSARNV